MKVFGKYSRRFILSVALGVLVFLVLSIYADYKETARSFTRFHWYLTLPILALALGNYLTRFLKWQMYLRYLEVNLPLFTSLRIFLAGLAMSVTPGKLGEVLKSYLLKVEKGISIARSSPIVVADRLTDFIALIIICIFGVVIYHFDYMMLAVAAALSLVFITIISSRRLSLAIIGVFERLPFIGKFAHKVEEFYLSTALLISFKPLIIATFISVIAWFCECLGFYITVGGFKEGSLMLGVFEASFIYAASTIAGAITMLPGGIGLTETSMTGLLVTKGMAESTAVASTFIIRACTLWFAVLVGVIALLLTKQSADEMILDVEDKTVTHPNREDDLIGDTKRGGDR